jgi:hypothetical protein
MVVPQFRASRCNDSSKRERARTRRKREALAKLEQELKCRPQTAADLGPSLFGDLYNDEIVFALGEVIAQGTIW